MGAGSTVRARARLRARMLAMLAAFVLLPLLTWANLSPQLQRAVDWLAAQVQFVAVSGEADSVANPVQVRGETVQTLRLMSRMPAPLADAVYAHDEGAPQIDTETLARRVLAGVPNSRDVTALLQSLRERRNADGGFGGGPGYRSSSLDTSWAVLAFAQGGQAAAAEAVAARQYLTSQLDADGAVRASLGGVRANAGTQTFTGALTSLALQTHTDGSDAVRRLTQHLSALQRSDGSWNGDTVVSSWVLLALSAVSSDAGLKDAASSFLLSRQSGDGSWSGDPYITAVALRALSARGAAVVAGSSGIKGSVIDAQSGLALEGASVAVTQGTSVPLASVSDLQGRFNLLDLPSGNYSVTFSRAGYQPVSSAVVIAAAQTLDLGQVRLLPSASSGLVRGMVTTLEGLPVAAATVQLTTAAGVQAALTDSLGRYEFSTVAVGSLTLTASFTGFQSASASASLLSGQTFIFSPALPRIGQTTGTTGQYFGQLVKASDGSPIAGASVIVAQSSTGATQTLTTSGDGRFAQTLNPGTYSARYSAVGFNPAEQRFALTAGTNVNAGSVALSLVKTTSDVRGKVLDTAGNPISGATVVVIDSSPAVSARSAADGAYWLANAGSISVSLRVSATGYNSQSVLLQSNFPTEMRHDFVLTSQSGGFLRIDALSLSPVSLSSKSLLVGTASVVNTGASPVSTSGSFLVFNDRNEKVAEAGLLDGTGQPLSDIAVGAASTLEVRLQWNTAQFLPGTYQAVLRLVENGSRTRDNPLGNLLVERGATFAITSTPLFSGALTINPPVLHATLGGSTIFTATLQNAGNAELAAGDYRLDVTNSRTGAIALTRTLAGPALGLSSLAKLEFGSWAPPAGGGDFSVSVVAASDLARGTLTGKLYVGESSTGTFVTDRSLVPTGSQKVRATVAVTGEDVAASISDPLAGPIKTAIQKSVTYGDLNASNWAASNKCLGCHVVTQALVGGELTRRFTTYSDLHRNTLFNSISTYRQSNGAVYGSHPEYARTQTMLGLWAYNSWRNRDEYAASLTSVADYVSAIQEVAGNWVADYPAGWWGAPSTHTAFNLKGLFEVVETLKRVPAPVAYTRQTVLNGGGLSGAYTLSTNSADQVVVANYTGGTVMAISLNGTTQTLLSGVTYPYGLLSLPDGSLLVGSANGVIRRAADGSQTSFAPLPNGIHYGSLALAPDGRVLMSSAGNHMIYAIPAAGGAASVYLSGGLLNGPTGMAADPAGNIVIANYYGQSIVRVRPDKTTEVVVRWTNGNPRGIVRQGNSWLVGTTTGVYRYNADWQGERLWHEQSDAVEVLADGTIVTGNGASLLSRLVPQTIDSTAKIAAYSTAIGKANTWLLADGNTNADSTMETAHRLIGLGAAKAFYIGTPAAGPIQAKMEQIATLLRSRQRIDGGWGMTTGHGSDSMVTAMVGYALDYLNPSADDPIVRKAIEFLLSRQQADGSWGNENGILGTRLAATTWVEIWLPIALDRIGGIDTHLTVRLPSSIAFSNSTTAPSSVVANADGSATHKWTLNSVTLNGRNLQFDLTLANMLAGESRPAALDAFLSFNNSFTNQTIDAAIGIPSVRASAYLDIAVRTDKPSYGADHPVIVSAPVVNGGAGANGASVRLAVLAPDNSLVTELGVFATGSIAAGATQTFNALWNTGTSIAAPGYKARAVLVGAQGQELAVAVAPFAIVGGSAQAASAKIVADRSAYGPNDTVQLTDTLRNLVSNGILENLAAHTDIRNASGAVVWQTSQPVAQLVGGSVKELRYSAPLTAALPGPYSANLLLKDGLGVTLASAATAFTVSDSANTGAGLKGTLTAVPTEVYAGDPVALSWSVSNAGNAAFSGLPIAVRIIDPATAQEVAQVPTNLNLALNQTVQRAQSWSTSDSHVGKVFVAALTARLANGTSVTLAQDSFRVIEPPIKLELGVHGRSEARVLALVSCPPGDDTTRPDEPNCLNIRVQGLDAALATLGVVHTIVTTKPDFERELRSSRYNTYWISGGSQKLSDTLVKEVRAAVQRGDGLVLDGVHDSRNQLLHPVAGVKQMGKLAGADQTIEILNSNVFALGNVGTAGRPTVFAIDSAEVHARFTQSGGNHLPAAAILTNPYGAGHSALFAFDLLQRLAAVPSDIAQLDLVRKALGYLATSDELTLQFGVTASGIEVFNSGSQAAHVWVQAALPAGVRFVGASAEASGMQPDAQGKVNWRFTLPADQRRTLVLRVAMDVPGPVDVPITVQAARSGSTVFKVYGTAALTLGARTLAQAAQDALVSISALLPTSNSEANAKSRALTATIDAQTLAGQGDFESAIVAWIKAADELLRIDTVDAQAARTAVARAIEGGELALQRQLGLQ